MPGSRRGLVAPQNTFLESIVRKCSGARKYYWHIYRFVWLEGRRWQRKDRPKNNIIIIVVVVVRLTNFSHSLEYVWHSLLPVINNFPIRVSKWSKRRRNIYFFEMVNEWSIGKSKKEHVYIVILTYANEFIIEIQKKKEISLLKSFTFDFRMNEQKGFYMNER